MTCFAALFLGQAALRLAGAGEWSWLAPAVGLSVAMLVASPMADLPGESTTVAILLGLLTVAAATWCLSSPEHTPPLTGLLAAAPVALLVAVPFLAAGRGGILGAALNNDMSVHLLIAEDFLSAAAAESYALPPDYPIGPHALSAALSRGLDTELPLAFSGWSLAIPVINAWTALAVARRASWLGKAVLATVVGLPFLVAAYYGQGAFKEVVQTGLVMAAVLSLSGYGPRLGRGRWVPFALLLGGMVCVYSLAGWPWPLVIAGLWLAGLLVIQIGRRRLHEVPGAVRRELPALGIGLAVLVVTLLPQVHRMWEFLALRDGTGITRDNLGNLVGPLSGWEAFGVWNNPDFRLPASPAFTAGMWTAFVLALVLFGAYWAFRRGRWLLPLSAAAAMVIWRVSEHSQSPYVSAKALVIASPLLLLLAALPLVDREPGHRPPMPSLLVVLLGLALFVRVGTDDLRSLRWSPVGPTDHAHQLETFRPIVVGQPTLFIGLDEFIYWELAGTSITPATLVSAPVLPIRPQKKWEYGQPLDFDSIHADSLNAFRWIVTPNDAASSAPPPQLRPVRSTEDFRLWRRVGRVRERSILSEGEGPGAVLRCDTRRGRAILAEARVASVRRPPIVAPVPSATAGSTVSARLELPAGEWELLTPYTSPLPVKVTAPGLSTTLEANLDRAGPRLPIGRIAVRRRGPLPITFEVDDTALAPPTAVAIFNRVVATPVGAPGRIVPIARACGKYVDWYR